jgi:PAS domain S-box-containing protein
MPRWLVAAFGVVFLALLIVGWWFYRFQEQQVRAEVEKDLLAISSLKVLQIANWRAERLATANEILDRRFTSDVIAPWMVSPRDEVTESILYLFGSLQKHCQYRDALLVDAEGLPRLSLSGRTAQVDSVTVEAIDQALREKRCVLTDLHNDTSGLDPHLDVIVPLLSGKREPPEPVGAIILQMDAPEYLYPLIKSWPTSSRSAETLLVRRDGDAVLFLNDVRHQRDTALNLRIPLGRSEVPAVMAVLGKEGLVDGKDYRGVEVLSVLKAIPDSPWFMVAKVDKAEVMAHWRLLSIIIPALVLGLTAAMAAAMGMAWQHYAKAHYRELFKSEAALREGESRYHTTVMSIGDGVIVTDVKGMVDLLNPVAETLTGWRQEEARGKPVAEVFRIVNEHTRNRVENPVKRVLREGAVVGLANHTLLIARDGREYPIADSGAPIRSNDDEIIGVVLVFRDQSEEMAFLRELRRSEENYRNLYDEAPAGYVEMSPEGRIERVNKKILEMLGYAEEEMLGRPIWEFVVERKDAEKVVKAKLSGRQDPGAASEPTLKRKHGQPIPVLIKDKFVKDHEGRILRMRAMIQDITETKKAEEALRAHEAQLAKINQIMSGILEHTHMLAALLDTQFNFIWVNRAYAAAGLQDTAFFIGKNHFDLYPHEENKSIFQKVVDTGEPFFITAKPFVYPGQPERGITYWDWSLIPIKDAAGTVTNLGFTLMEVTERVRAQEELRKAHDQLELRVRERTAELVRKNRELQDFAFVASHDLSEPLRKIQTFGDLLNIKGANCLGEAEKDYVSRMTGAANRMQELLNALLAYSRLDTKAQGFTNLNLDEIVRDAVSDLDVTIGRIGARVEIGPLPSVNGDPVQLRQLFQNLIANALKYSRSDPKPFVRIHGEKNHDYCRILVEDNGIGFDEKYLDKIFQPFQRLHGRNEYSGTGMGLAICRRIVERHHGVITARSTPGKGSTFIITLRNEAKE